MTGWLLFLQGGFSMDIERDLQQQVTPHIPGTGHREPKTFNGTQNLLIESLTPREAEILKLIAGGLSTKRIAWELRISFKTAACHRAHIMDKLEVHQVAHLVRYAIRHKLIEP
jgi:DNA-binding NarL/FixJ family response regulator